MPKPAAKPAAVPEFRQPHTAMNILQSAKSAGDANCLAFRKQMLADLEWRRTTCNHIARILRRLGLTDAKADQSDHGRRDVIATINGKQVTIGCFYGPRRYIAVLAPQFHRRTYPEWTPVATDLRNLPRIIRNIAVEIFTA